MAVDIPMWWISAKPGLLLFIFVFFSIQYKIAYKSVDGVIGIWTPDRRMVGADERT